MKAKLDEAAYEQKMRAAHAAMNEEAAKTGSAFAMVQARASEVQIQMALWLERERYAGTSAQDITGAIGTFVVNAVENMMAGAPPILVRMALKMVQEAEMAALMQQHDVIGREFVVPREASDGDA